MKIYLHAQSIFSCSMRAAIEGHIDNEFSYIVFYIYLCNKAKKILKVVCRFNEIVLRATFAEYSLKFQ